MKNLFLAICICLIVGVLKAQNTFKLSYDKTKIEYALNSFELSNNQIINGIYCHDNQQGFGANILKIDADGNNLWSRDYTFVEHAFILNSFEQVSNDEFILAGIASNINSGKRDFCLLKVDSGGSVVWSKIIPSATNEANMCIDILPDGSIILAGGIYDYPNRAGYIPIIKLDVNGNIVWSKIISAGNGNELYGTKITITDDGGFAIVGAFINESNHEKKIFLIKLDVSGNIEWSKIYDANGLAIDAKELQASDKGFVVVGTALPSNNVYLFKTDSLGNLEWEKILRGDEQNYYGRDVIEDADGGFVVLGSAANLEQGVFLTKTNETGDVQWSKFYGDGSDVSPGIWGGLQKTVNGGFLIGASNWIENQFNVYLAKTDETGNVDCYSPDFPLRDSTLHSTADVSNYNVLSTNLISVDLPVVIEHVDFTALNMCLLGDTEDKTPSTINIYPNPSNGIFTISDLGVNTKMEIFDIYGRLVFKSVVSNSKTIDLTTYPKGLYVLAIEKDNKTIFYERIVLQ